MITMKNAYIKAAFSLVELSIVLVILGLLIGGILSGQSLIRAAELRSVSTEYNRYVAATQTFRDKYFALPGDMTNATAFWNAAAVCPGASTDVATTSATCNGDGNGNINFIGLTNSTHNETFRFWQHLANAGLIEGSFSGVITDPAGYFAAAGTANSPKSKLGNNAVWLSTWEDNSSGTWNGAHFHYRFGNALYFGGVTTNSWNSTGVLKPEEAWNVDTKIDDGQAGRGKLTGRVGANCTSAATGADFNATYMLTQSGLNCFMVFTF
jgi:prepilin-type N-terminal cleavage/methylation domain-containing protein